jgi:predicted nucleic acid-binding protein
LVLDSWAVLAWMQDEPAASRVQGFLDQAAARSLVLQVSAINAGEVYYQLLRARGREVAGTYWREATSRAMPLRIAAVTLPRVRRAAAIKARYPLAYADAFAVALAVELGWPLVTGDPEIRRPAADGLLQLVWLGGA